MTTDVGRRAAALAVLEAEKGPTDPARAASVVAAPPESAAGSPPQPAFLLWAIGAGPSPITPWGTNVVKRDRELRAFIPSESFLVAALSIVTARNAAMAWSLTGDDGPVDVAHEMLANANFGRGLEHLESQTSYDLYTQDKGAFIEIVRAADSPNSPTIGINHLDAGRCFLTGNPEFPVLYLDTDNKWHKMRWYQVIHLLEMPAATSPDVVGFDWQIQYCALTRVFHAAQVIKDLVTYKGEKLGGRYERAIHLVRGVTPDEIRDAMTRDRMLGDAAGRTRYSTPPIVGSVDPRAEVGHDTIDMASLPDGFNEKESLELYLLALSMGFLTDYQEFAPLPGGGLGTSAQSEILHAKSRGKGPGLYRRLFSRAMNMHGILPKGVEFAFDEQDIEEDQQIAEAEKTRGETRALRIGSGEIDTRTAQVLAVEDGDLTQEQLDEQVQREEEEAAAAEAAALALAQQRPPTVGEGTPGDRPQQTDEIVEGEERPASERALGMRADASPGDEREEFEEESAVAIEGAFGRVQRMIGAALREADDET